ncbi:MAG: homoserine dehydrogenase [Acutalibacteraceae bacterium]|nr:homoserine dehydrogenase [Acutalibacteraceae bacterium]
MINIAIMGHGVVGSGVVEVLTHNSESIERRAADKIYIKHILDLREFPESPLCDRFTKDFNDILNDDSVKIVVETMGGINPAYNFVKSCLLAGKSVVTSNKELVATHGQELLTIARENNLNFLFEASVGGGIPIIRPMIQCLAANEISEITGILNGTTNFIMTKMIRDNTDFSDALSLAQELGYAERDPSADIEGHDACRKICILASLAFGKHVYPNQVYTDGITKITLNDVKYAEKWGGVIKLLGRVKMLENGKINVTVYPAFVPNDSQLSLVDDVFNAIMINGDATGEVMFYGRGAGKLPTASAVVADVIDCVKHVKARKYLYWADTEDNYVVDHLDTKAELFIRIKTENYDGDCEKISEQFGEVRFLSDVGDEIAFITKEGVERDLLNSLDKTGLNAESVIHILY